MINSCTYSILLPAEVSGLRYPFRNHSDALPRGEGQDINANSRQARHHGLRRSSLLDANDDMELGVP